MASYIPGITDYIPQAQPFQPDYNFLGNMMQNSQSKYDQNYQNLNKAYGTLLNSPMLREDNMKQRDEFFQMIDGDIKRISGMDLSLQQNVDSANKVFDSFYKNKSIVKDMTFTRAYQKELAFGENLRNCTTCEQKYWEEGANALQYRAEEYKKASKEDAMSMDPGRFTPFINIQEKATKYAKDMLGSTGPFGVSTVVPSADGKWQVTLKNGSLLSTPLQQILINQYGKDPDIIAMNETDAYVKRKGYIAANAAKFGGNEDAAEDEYFNIITNDYINRTKTQHDSAQTSFQNIAARKNLLEARLKREGSTGNDELSQDILAINLDHAAAKEAVSYYDESVRSFEGLAQNSDRRLKRNTIDKMLGRDIMTRTISESAQTVANLTGQTSKEIDPYAKSYYDFGLDMKKLEKQYSLMDRNEANKAVYEIEKHKAITEYNKRGSLDDNTGTLEEGVTGTTALNAPAAQKEIQTDISQSTSGVKENAQGYTNGYANTLIGVLNDGSSSADETTLAKTTLTNIYGNYSKGKAGFDPKENQFRDAQGNLTSNPVDIADDNNYIDLYKRTKEALTQNSKVSDISKTYQNKDGANYQKNYETDLNLLKINSNKWRTNNKNVKDWGNTVVEDNQLADWNDLFRANHSLKTESEYIEDYTKKYSNMNFDPNEVKEIAQEAYADMNTKYNDIYNGGHSKGKDKSGRDIPLVETLHYNNTSGKGTGGISSGGAVHYTFNSTKPALNGTAGLLSLATDAVKENTVFGIGIDGTLEDVLAGEGSSNAQIAFQTLVNDIKTGNYSKTEKDDIRGDISYMDVALSDYNKVGVNIKFPVGWLDKYKGTGDNLTWADDPRLVTEGASVYVDKNKATNSFTKAAKQQKFDVIIDHEDVVVSKPNGGSVKILKRDNNGHITIQGMLHGVDGEGNLEQHSISQTYTNDPGGQNIYNNMNLLLEDIDEKNTAYLASLPKNKIREVTKLPGVQKAIQTASGNSDIDLTSIFTQNMQNISQ